ncbi:MAG: leucyl aminopeptidase family protein [Actinomycetes bacterium]
MNYRPTIKSYLTPLPVGTLNNSTLGRYLKGIDAAVFAVGQSESGPKLFKSAILTALETHLDRKLASEFDSWPDFTAKAGEIIELPVKQAESSLTRIYLVGVGSGSREEFRRSGAAFGRKVKNSGKTILISTLSQRKRPTVADEEAAVAHLVALSLSNYTWTMKTSSLAKPVTFLVPPNLISEVEYAATLASAVWRARDLIHTPSNIKNPAWMAAQAKSQIAATKSKDLSIEVLSGSALAEFGGLRAVGNSSPNPGPRFIKVSYAPAGSKNWPHVVLVGKGITFDTGGVSLKRPYEFMIAMKSDMAGAAAVLSVVTAMPELAPKVRVTALLMCAENLLSATSQRPSDVITQYGGTTVEIIDTDAEGRLVLADGLAYANRNLKPDYLIDVATLTGSATLGLGRQYAAMYSRNNKLAATLHAIGERIGDRVWQLPLVAEYRPALQSEVADLNHTADKKHFSGGSITAALFLEYFAEKSNWVHLDIAGTGRSDSDAGENPKGGTGFGVRLLIDWIATL